MRNLNQLRKGGIHLVLTLLLESWLGPSAMTFAKLKEFATKNGEGLLAFARGERTLLEPQLQMKDRCFMVP